VQLHPGAAPIKFEDRIEVLLDEALEATFPASDPVALAMAAQRWHADRLADDTDSVTDGICGSEQ
jgi:hypothetical protein